MRLVMENLDNHPVLTSAAYNAGPGRAEKVAGRPAARGRHLRRNHPIQRNPRLRQDRDERLGLLLRTQYHRPAGLPSRPASASIGATHRPMPLRTPICLKIQHVLRQGYVNNDAHSGRLAARSLQVPADAWEVLRDSRAWFPEAGRSACCSEAEPVSGRAAAPPSPRPSGAYYDETTCERSERSFASTSSASLDRLADISLLGE